jgi:PPOX class probable F420-dependent enzyme
MPDNNRGQFIGQKYLNLQTYRKNGKAVPTPVWFAADNHTLYLYSLASAGKVKRIRNNPNVQIAPCDMRGRIKGEWVGAKARIVDENEAEVGHRLLIRKYGLVKKVGDFFSKLRKRERVVIAIELD